MNTSMNQSLFLWLNHACTALPDWLWASLTITGHTSVAFALLTPLLTPLLLIKAQHGGARVITALFICTPLGGLVSTLLKESFQMARPPAALPQGAFHLIGHKLELVSFPSGHTLTAFAVATLLILGFSLRGWRLWGLCALATAIGLSRIAVGAHWPLDVLVGAMLGSLCAYVSLIVTQSSYCSRILKPSQFYKWLQIAVFFLVSASLAITSTGYPEARYWQWLVSAFGVMMTSYAAILHLKQGKVP